MHNVVNNNLVYNENASNTLKSLKHMMEFGHASTTTNPKYFGSINICIGDGLPVLKRTYDLGRWHPSIRKVIFNDPATIIMWGDGTKTVVKAHNEKYDPEKGLAMAIAEKYYGTYSKFKKEMPDG